MPTNLNRACPTEQSHHVSRDCCNSWTCSPVDAVRNVTNCIGAVGYCGILYFHLYRCLLFIALPNKNTLFAAPVYEQPISR